MSRTDEKQTYVVSRRGSQIFSFLLNGSKAVEIHCDACREDSILDEIYIGKVQNIVKNISAAFVEIAPGTVCYLPLEDLKHPVYTKKGTSQNIQQGDELLVQVKREGIKTKAPAVTTNLTLHGKYALLTTGNTQISVSSKLSKEEKERLLRVVKDNSSADNGSLEGMSAGERAYGWLLRTNAGGASPEVIKKDLLRLQTKYGELMKTAQYRTCFSCLLARPSAYLKRLSDLYTEEVDEILTDDRELFEQMTEYFQENQPEDTAKLRFYEDRLLPMEKLYSLDHHLKEALGERVWLKSGGYLVIQPTEALTVIDVNTGKFTAGKKKEAAFLKLNQEAALEAARQIRLRNLSGIVIIDFINMEETESETQLLRTLDGALRLDPIRTTLVDMTKLSLVEITRMKKERPLHESVGKQS
ncbi:MAG: ribonuclease E/G [Lachnospiraceae bacterium]